MKGIYLVSAFLALFILSCTPKDNSCGPDNEYKQIFDGKTFKGWEGPKEFFRIEDQAIVAGTLDRQIPINQFLCTEERYENFELRMKVKFTSSSNNAGIQFRSKRIPNHHEVIGYQADVGFLPERPIWGSLYDESRRKVFLKDADSDLVLKSVDKDGWNDYHIYCLGSLIRLSLNGIVVLEYEEEMASVPTNGVICVQIHSGSPAEAWYKDICIMDL